MRLRERLRLRPPRARDYDYLGLGLTAAIGYAAGVGRGFDLAALVRMLVFVVLFVVGWWLAAEMLRYVRWAKVAEGSGDPGEVKRVITEKGLKEDERIAVVAVRVRKASGESEHRWVLYRRRWRFV